MADLIAQGDQPAHRWRRDLPAAQTVLLGRQCEPFAVPWDEQISRHHAQLCFRNGQLAIRKLDAARNAIFFQGAERTRFSIRPGEHFVIGQTTFTLTDEKLQFTSDARSPTEEKTFSARYLSQVHFRNARARIAILARLPEVISSASSDRELMVRVVSMVLAGIGTADAAALVRVAPGGAPTAAVEVLHWDRHLGMGRDFRPSERLIRAAVDRGESLLYVWRDRSESHFTARQDVDWAFCTPLLGEACPGWAIYVAGRLARGGEGGADKSDASDLREDLKFTEVAAATLRSLQELRRLERRHAGLSRFFSPVVLEAIASEDPEVILAPRETEVTVLFCDLRGFARESERAAGDLLGLLDRVSRALGATTHHILAQGGVVGDFQGDAVMGFWGWPLVQPDRIERACRTALAIRAELDRAAKRRDDPLAGFRMGIGMATGTAVAGRIGTADQVKVTVFGPVVNLASRLEGMTRLLRVPILLDEPTARQVRERMTRDEARCRRLAVVRPAGMDTAVEVSELLPPADEYPLISDEDLATYERALEELVAGDWSAAFRDLHRIPAEDRAKDFLTVLIAQHHRTPPPGWDGVIPLSEK